VVWGTSAAAGVSALLVGLIYRDGPFQFGRGPFRWDLATTVLGHRETRLAIGGYLGHMWELYAMWAWLPAFLAASFARHGALPSHAADLVGFAAIAAGGLGCLWGGWASQRIGYARVVTIAMAASGACSLGIGLLFGGDPAWVIVVALVWGFFVVADSAQFSAMVTDVTPQHAVGTALTLQTSMGFLLTMATIQLVPLLVAHEGWRWAFPALALGPIFGIASIARLVRK
jgi:MFS family permease